MKTMVWLPVSAVFNVRTLAGARDCTHEAGGGGGGGGGGVGGRKHAVCVSALKVGSGRKVPCRTGDSNPRQYGFWRFSRTLYQVSYPANTCRIGTLKFVGTHSLLDHLHGYKS